MKRIIGSTFLIYVVITIVDMIVHGKLLTGVYEQTESLWRPMEEMKVGVMTVVTLVVSLSVTLLYKYFVSCKCALCGTKFGLLIGLIVGIGMGFGSYSFMPIPCGLAVAWFFTAWVQYTLAGLVAGIVIRESTCKCKS